jgi:hypothetical protein
LVIIHWPATRDLPTLPAGTLDWRFLQDPPAARRPARPPRCCRFAGDSGLGLSDHDDGVPPPSSVLPFAGDSGLALSDHDDRRSRGRRSLRCTT